MRCDVSTTRLRVLRTVLPAIPKPRLGPVAVLPVLRGCRAAAVAALTRFGVLAFAIAGIAFFGGGGPYHPRRSPWTISMTWRTIWAVRLGSQPQTWFASASSAGGILVTVSLPSGACLGRRREQVHPALAGSFCRGRYSAIERANRRRPRGAGTRLITLTLLATFNLADACVTIGV